MKKYILNNGIELDIYEMMNIKNHYEKECTKEYILENFDYTDEEAERLAFEVREMMSDEDITETEALQSVLGLN